MKNNKRGFTLIEIVMVLVLLGILAAVAVPKFYDLRDKAEEQTAKAVAAEFQARLNGMFASQLLQEKKEDGSYITCQDAREAAVTEANKLATVEAEKKAHGFTISQITGTVAKGKDETTSITLTKSKSYTATIALPVCK